MLLLGVGLPAVTVFALSLSSAQGIRRFGATLEGYQEVPTLSTPAEGEFTARINDAGNIEYELSYSGFTSAVTGSHIHLGRPGTTGGVSAFLCGGGDKPACPQGSGSVTGVIDAADVIGPAGQGIAAGEFDELLAAMRAGATYANVHSATYPSGEIRGAIKGFRGRGRADD